MFELLIAAAIFFALVRYVWVAMRTDRADHDTDPEDALASIRGNLETTRPHVRAITVPKGESL